MPDSIAQLTAALSAHYAVERELGAGGMATVYLARDLKHNRYVAIKVLRPELAAILGGERFLKEIRLTANLQHPHILPLHDSGEADGLVYYVMPFVEGESLRDRLKREKQLPVEDAIRLAREVASALDYAHRHGVVHRDIKPENVLLHDGQALVADFGIALAVSTAGGERMTETGLSVGTPHYMSPEQAMGDREITPRSDVYALGCVTYEMLLGEPPFTGPSAQAIIARVVTEEPRSLIVQRKTIPPHVEDAVHVALAKLPADRFATAAEFATALLGPSQPRAGTTASRAAAIQAPQARGWRKHLPLIKIGAAATVAVAIAFVAGRSMHGASEPSAASAIFKVTVPPEERLSGPPSSSIALSPDGTTLVYVGTSGSGFQLFRRRLDEVKSTPIPGTDQATEPTFSPDGRWIAYNMGLSLFKVPLTGGGPVRIPTPEEALQSWIWAGANEFIACTEEGALARLKADGSTERIALPDAEAGETNLIPWGMLPDGDVLVIAATQGAAGPLLAIDPRSGTRSVISKTIVSGAGYDRGYLVWVQPDGALFAAPYSAGKHTVSGSVMAIAKDVRVTPGGPAEIAVSRSGSLAYIPPLPSDLVMVDRQGRTLTLLQDNRGFHSPRVSPDGRRIAMSFTEQSARDVWLLDLRDRKLARLSFEGDGRDPNWMPGGERITYVTALRGTDGIYSRRADGSGKPESVLVVPGTRINLQAFTPDGRTGIAAGGGGGMNWDLVTFPLVGARVPQPLLVTSYSEGWPALSPDGRWLAYVSDESGRQDVYVRRFPGGAAKVIVSENGGTEPVWSRDGRELFYRGFGGTQGAMLEAVTVDTRGDFRVAGRTTLFSMAGYEAATPHANYDVTPDGKGFVMVRQGVLTEIVLIQNWTALVRRQAEAAAQ